MSVASETNAAPFYVVAREPGAENPSLPTWTPTTSNPIELATSHTNEVTRKDLPQVPGAFQLLNVLSAAECERLVALTESLGYLPDAPVSLPRNVRHNDNVTMVVDPVTDELIWQRVAALFLLGDDNFQGRQALGLNARFRFYRYQAGDFFKPHSDGSWPGSRVINRKLVGQAYDDRWSEMTFLIFLTDDFDGGETQFWVHKDNPSLPARLTADVKKVNIRTPKGSVLAFPHGQHPMHCLHSSQPILSGTKYIVRTDVLFEL
ncbi:MAG: 2OG-Fe(II) oxygenase [Gammaproteobacteria bacterium]|nr:2OG-Fe(II) oxygenase [Gammaproteobacteria bacterium]